MQNNKGFVSLMLSIIIVLGLVGAGAYYYKSTNNPSNVSDTDYGQQAGSSISDDKANSPSNTVFSSSPKELFLARNTEMFNARSFEELQSTGEKYDSTSKIQEDAEQVKYMNPEKKKALFGFSQAFLTPTQEFISVEESITGNTAKVIAKTKTDKEINATFIKENGSWKLSDDSIVNLGNK